MEESKENKGESQEPKEEAKGKVENILRELGRKIDELIDETKDAKDDVRDEVERKIEELKVKRDEIEEDWEHYRKNEKWQDTKSHLSGALSELKAAFDTIFTNKKS